VPARLPSSRYRRPYTVTGATRAKANFKKNKTVSPRGAALCGSTPQDSSRNWGSQEAIKALQAPASAGITARGAPARTARGTCICLHNRQKCTDMVVVFDHKPSLSRSFVPRGGVLPLSLISAHSLPLSPTNITMIHFPSPLLHTSHRPPTLSNPRSPTPLLSFIPNQLFSPSRFRTPPPHPSPCEGVTRQLRHRRSIEAPAHIVHIALRIDAVRNGT
jgi:hypothetical protein